MKGCTLISQLQSDFAQCEDAIAWLQSLSRLPAGSCVLTGSRILAVCKWRGGDAGFAFSRFLSLRICVFRYH